MYELLRNLHILFAVVSVTGFAARGLLAIVKSSWLDTPWLKRLPHVNDTLLFAAGIALMVITHQYPGSAAWITAKLIAVLLYIVFGFIALRRSFPAGLRVTSGLAALATIGYIVSVAITKHPLPG